MQSAKKGGERFAEFDATLPLDVVYEAFKDWVDWISMEVQECARCNGAGEDLWI